MRCRRVWALISLLLAAPALATERLPTPVSPGVNRGIAAVDAVCPTFNWAGVEGALSYDLAVFAAPVRTAKESEREVGRVRLRPILQYRVPGAALGWTPPAGSCFQRGATYGWVVRAVGPEGAGAWSEPHAFRVSHLPSDEEVRNALEVLRGYLGRTTGGESERAALTGLDSEHEASTLLRATPTGTGPPPPPPPPISFFTVDHTGSVFSPGVHAEGFFGPGGGLTGVNAQWLQGRTPSSFPDFTHTHPLPSGSTFLAGPALTSVCSGATSSVSSCSTPACGSVNASVSGGGCSFELPVATPCLEADVVVQKSEPDGLGGWTCQVRCTSSLDVIAKGFAICPHEEYRTGFLYE